MICAWIISRFQHEKVKATYHTTPLTWRADLEIRCVLPGNQDGNPMQIPSFSWLIYKFAKLRLLRPSSTWKREQYLIVSLVWSKGTYWQELMVSTLVSACSSHQIGCCVPVNFPVNPNPIPYAPWQVYLLTYGYIWHSLLVNVGKNLPTPISTDGNIGKPISRCTGFSPVDPKIPTYPDASCMQYLSTIHLGHFWGYVSTIL